MDFAGACCMSSATALDGFFGMHKADDPIPYLKEQLRHEIVALVGDWDPYVAAARLGTDQPRMSDLKRGRLERFSLEKLIRLLVNVDQTVEITVVGPTRIQMFVVRNPHKKWRPPPHGPVTRRGPPAHRG
jgi:hypothetical protein